MESSQLSAKCWEISVPDLYGVLTVQLCGMYITFVLTEIFISKEYLEPKDYVHNNVRSGLTYVLLVLEYLEVCQEALNRSANNWWLGEKF